MKFLLTFENDAAGASRMSKGLTEGWDAIAQGLARFGGELVNLHAVLGRFSAVAIVDFEDAPAAFAFVLAATSQGQRVEAMLVLDQAEVARAAERSNNASAAFAREVRDIIESASPHHDVDGAAK